VPLLTLQGEVIGVNSTIFSETGANSGVGFSIPVNAVKRVVPDLIARGEYVYPYIGISMAPPLSLEELEALNLPPNGVYVTSVTPNTPADTAHLVGSSTGGGFDQGLLPGGDYILAIDGNPVSSSDELITYLIFETEVGQTVEFTVLRDGQEIAVPLTLGARP
jgi:2-alkenal reductase